MKPRNCLIFGASGQIGRNLIRKLTQKNLKVTAVTRNLHQKGYILKTQANPGYLDIVETNLFNQAKIEELISKADVCINLVGILFEKGPNNFTNIHEKFPAMISKFCSKHNIHKFIHLSALGIENAKGDTTVIMMADMSDDIEDLKKYNDLIERENLDAVLGSRFIKGSEVISYPFQKLILNRIFNLFVSLIFWNKYNDYTNAFKIYKTKILKDLMPLVSESFNIFLEIPLKVISRKYNYKIIPIRWMGRKKGKAKFKIKELRSKYLFTLIYCFIEKNLLNIKK